MGRRSQHPRHFQQSSGRCEDERSEEMKKPRETPTVPANLELRYIICVWLPFIRQDDQDAHRKIKTEPKPASQEVRVPGGQHSKTNGIFLTRKWGADANARTDNTLCDTTKICCLSHNDWPDFPSGQVLYQGRIPIRVNRRRYCCIYPPGPGPYIRCLFSGRSSPMASGIRWMGGVPTCWGNPPRCIPPGVRTIWGPLTPPPAVMYPPASRFGDA